MGADALSTPGAATRDRDRDARGDARPGLAQRSTPANFVGCSSGTAHRHIGCLLCFVYHASWLMVASLCHIYCTMDGDSAAVWYVHPPVVPTLASGTVELAHGTIDGMREGDPCIMTPIPPERWPSLAACPHRS